MDHTRNNVCTAFVRYNDPANVYKRVKKKKTTLYAFHINEIAIYIKCVICSVAGYANADLLGYVRNDIATFSSDTIEGIEIL